MHLNTRVQKSFGNGILPLFYYVSAEDMKCVVSRIHSAWKIIFKALRVLQNSEKFFVTTSHAIIEFCACTTLWIYPLAEIGAKINQCHFVESRVLPWLLGEAVKKHIERKHIGLKHIDPEHTGSKHIMPKILIKPYST